MIFSSSIKDEEIKNWKIFQNKEDINIIVATTNENAKNLDKTSYEIIT